MYVCTNTSVCVSIHDGHTCMLHASVTVCVCVCARVSKYALVSVRTYMYVS